MTRFALLTLAVLPAAAFAAFGETRDPDLAPAVRLLVTGLQQKKEGDLRLASAAALARLGSAAEPAMPALLDALSDDSADLRAAAGEALSSIGRPAVDPLRTALTSEKSEARQAAGMALGRLGENGREAVQDLLNVLGNDDDPQVRAAAADALGQIGGPEAVAGLTLVLQDPNALPVARQWVAAKLGNLISPGDDQAKTQLLETLLKDKDAHVRAAAAAALSAFTSRSGWLFGASEIRIFVQALHDGEPDVVRHSALALGAGAFGSEARDTAIQPLQKLLAGGPLPVRLAAASALTRVGGYPEIKTVQASLRALLKEKMDPADQVAILKAIQEAPVVSDDDAAASLTDLLESPEPDVQLNAAQALANLGPIAKSAVPDLIKALGKARVTVARRSALEDAMGPLAACCLDRQEPAVPLAMLDDLMKIGPDAKAAVPTLGDVLHNGPAGSLRSAAARALQAIGPDAKGAVSQLQAALGDANGQVRTSAAAALGAIRVSAKDAVEGLRRCLREDDDPAVREAAADALGEIGPDAAAAVAELGEALRESNNDRLQSAVTRALSSIGAASAPVLAKALRNDKDNRVRRAAAETLGSMGPTAGSALPSLTEAMQQDQDELVRAASASALGAVGIADLGAALPALQEALGGDKSPSVQRDAARALGAIGPKAGTAVPALVCALGADRPAEVREAAAVGLGAIRTDDPSAIRGLARLLREDGVESVSRAASEAIVAAGLSRETLNALVDVVRSSKDMPRRLEAASALGLLAAKGSDQPRADGLLHDLARAEEDLIALRDDPKVKLDPDNYDLADKAVNAVHQAWVTVNDNATKANTTANLIAWICQLTIALLLVLAVVVGWGVVSTCRPQWLTRANERLDRFYATTRCPLWLRFQIPIGFITKRHLVLLADLKQVRRDMGAVLPPEGLVQSSGLEIGHRRRAASQVSGDFYLFLETTDGGLGITLGDTPGHGLHAASQAHKLMVITLRKGAWGRDGDAYSQLQLADEWVEQDAQLLYGGKPGFCMSFIKIDRARGVIQHANAGMPLVTLYRGGDKTPLAAKGMLVGAGYRRYAGKIKPRQVETVFEDGDLLVIVSDGVLHALNSAGELFGQRGVDAVVARYRHRGPDGIAEEILRGVIQHAGADEPDDDQTLIVVRLRR